LLLASFSSTLGEILISLDDVWSQIIMVFISALIVLVSMIKLIPSIGVSGVFLAMALSTFVTIVWSWHKLTTKLQTCTK
jgi:O-antigen/teichoic acid export membrane protein